MDKAYKEIPINGFGVGVGVGFSLLEALIALVIVSVGLLGIAALQTLALRNTQAANIASQATISAHDMIERMRANPMGMKSKAYDSPSPISHSDCYTTIGCTTTELAENDMYEWASSLAPQSISKKIPQGSAIVCIDSTPDDGIKANDVASPNAAACDGVGDIYAIKIWSGELDTPRYQRFVTTVIL